MFLAFERLYVSNERESLRSWKYSATNPSIYCMNFVENSKKLLSNKKIQDSVFKSELTRFYNHMIEVVLI